MKDRDYAFVQPIVVGPLGTHEETVAAAAKASVGAYLTTREQPEWREWIEGRFVKTVRRAKGKELESAKNGSVFGILQGEVEAYGFLPVPKNAVPREIAKLQVQGLERERTGEWPAEGGIAVFVREDLKMSTGKMAAQVAHGLVAISKSFDKETREAWLSEGLPITVSEISTKEWEECKKRGATVIRDSGFTEIDPETETVLVFGPGVGVVFGGPVL